MTIYTAILFDIILISLWVGYMSFILGYGSEKYSNWRVDKYGNLKHKYSLT